MEGKNIWHQAGSGDEGSWEAMHGGTGEFTGENLLAGPGLCGAAGGRQHAGDLERSAWSRCAQVMAVDQGRRDTGFLREGGYRCEAGQQVPLPLTLRKMM